MWITFFVGKVLDFSLPEKKKSKSHKTEDRHNSVQITFSCTYIVITISMTDVN